MRYSDTGRPCWEPRLGHSWMLELLSWARQGVGIGSESLVYQLLDVVERRTRLRNHSTSNGIQKSTETKITLGITIGEST